MKWWTSGAVTPCSEPGEGSLLSEHCLHSMWWESQYYCPCGWCLPGALPWGLIPFPFSLTIQPRYVFVESKTVIGEKGNGSGRWWWPGSQGREEVASSGRTGGGAIVAIPSFSAWYSPTDNLLYSTQVWKLVFVWPIMCGEWRGRAWAFLIYVFCPRQAGEKTTLCTRPLPSWSLFWRLWGGSVVVGIVW